MDVMACSASRSGNYLPQPGYVQAIFPDRDLLTCFASFQPPPDVLPYGYLPDHFVGRPLRKTGNATSKETTCVCELPNSGDTPQMNASS